MFFGDCWLGIEGMQLVERHGWGGCVRARKKTLDLSLAKT